MQENFQTNLYHLHYETPQLLAWFFQIRQHWAMERVLQDIDCTYHQALELAGEANWFGSDQLELYCDVKIHFLLSLQHLSWKNR